MRSYGQFCLVAKAAELFCERWTPLIIRELGDAPRRFSQLQRGVPLMSPSLLSRRLKQLEAEGIVARMSAGDGNAYLYELTAAGRDFVPMVESLGNWGMRWSRRELEAQEMDMGLLLWAMEKNARPDALGGGRSVVELRFTDQPAHKTEWWFLNEDSRCMLCHEYPGFDVDIYLSGTLADIIYLVRGDLPLAHAISDGRIDLHGARGTSQRFKNWLNLGPWAQVQSKRTA